VDVESTRHDLGPQTALNAAQRQRPLDSWARRWGDEVYFETPAVAGEEEARELVSVGDVAYWPPGRALPDPAARRAPRIASSAPPPVWRLTLFPLQ